MLPAQPGRGAGHEHPFARRRWPAEGLTRVPYWLYSDRDLYAEEQERIFRGNTWTFLCLEAELPKPSSFRVSNLGDMPVVVTRDADGVIHAFENRCAHRGSLLCLKERGEAKEIACVYHNWTYDLTGRLTGVAFRRGIAGKGGMPADCKPEEHAPRQLRVETFAGLVFGTLGTQTPPLEDYLGPDHVAHIKRVMRAPAKLLGGYSQIIPSNWKLYVENVKDSYHASLLHMFFTTFRLNRLSQKGGLVVSESGGNHISYSMTQDVAGKEYEQAGLRSASEGYALEAPELLLHSVDEFGDGIGLQILTVFPGFVLQQIRNCLAVRRVVPRGLDRTELVWTCFGFDHRRRGDDRAAAAPGQPDRPGGLHLDGGWRGVQVSFSAAPPAPATKYPSSRWAAAAPLRRKAGSARPRCAASGRNTAN